MKPLVPVESIQQQIYLIRGHRVMLDRDLADLYQVTTKRLNEQVKRNPYRFPEDFMFQLSHNEASSLRSQIATSKKGRGGRRYLPYVFTEQGVAMLSSILQSRQAVEVNIAIMRTFVHLRQVISLHRDLARRIAAQEKKTEGLTDYVQKMFDLIQPLLDGPVKPIKKIGFHPKT